MSRFTNQEAQPAVVKGHELKCPICNNGYFRTRRVLLNTPVATFFGFDWANRNAKCYICSNCTHIMWFLE